MTADIIDFQRARERYPKSKEPMDFDVRRDERRFDNFVDHTRVDSPLSVLDSICPEKSHDNIQIETGTVCDDLSNLPMVDVEPGNLLIHERDVKTNWRFLVDADPMPEKSG